MKRVRWPVLASALALAIGGCTGGTASDRPALVQRDSGGVRIVESGAPAWQPGEGWRIDSTPEFSIGTADGSAEYQLSAVRGVVRLRNGRIIVANAGSSEIRAYDAAGRFLWSSGRRGQGPGDFVNIGILSRYRGDSVLVFDLGRAMRSTYSVIGPDGRFARQWTAEAPDDSTHYLGFVGAWPDGTLALRSRAPVGPADPPRVTRADSRLYRYDPAGRVVARLGAFPGDEWYQGSGYAIRTLPWGRTTYYATGDSGIYVGTNDRFEIRHLRTDGTVDRVIRRAVAVRPVTADEVVTERTRLKTAQQAMRDSFFRGMPDSIRRRIDADEDAMFDVIPFPASYPAYDGLLADDAGTLWVGAFDAHADADGTVRRWSIFRRDGRWLGDVTLPPHFALYGADSARVLGVQTDDLGVPFVRAFRIRGRRPA